MTQLGDRILARLNEIGMSQSELARQSGKHQSTINVIIKGKSKSPGNLAEIATALGVTVDWLVGVDTSVQKKVTFVPAVRKPTLNTVNPMPNGVVGSIPIKAVAAGDLAEGKNLPSKNIGQIAWPPSFVGMEDVYSVFVSGDSMAPAFNNKDIALISPYLPYGKGDIVIFVEKYSETASEKMSIKTFDFEKAGQVVFSQLNPPMQITIATKNIQYIHKVLSHREIVGI